METVLYYVSCHIMYNVDTVLYYVSCHIMYNVDTVLYCVSCHIMYNVDTVLYYVSCHIMYTNKYTMWRRYFTMLVVISCKRPSIQCGDGTLPC